MKTNGTLWAMILTTIVLLVLPGAVWSQDAESGSFVRELVKEMERIGWSSSETGELERHMNTYRWEHLRGVDPEVMAIALQYAQEKTVDRLTARQMARLTLQLTYAAREMASFGFEGRQIARGIMNETRVMTEQQWRLNESVPELSEQTRDQIRQRIRNTEGSLLMERLRTRTRSSNPKDPDSWSDPGPGPGGEPGGRNSSPPNGPNGPGSGQGSPDPGHGQ